MGSNIKHLISLANDNLLFSNGQKLGLHVCQDRLLWKHHTAVCDAANKKSHEIW